MKRKLINLYNAITVLGKQKIFCIGLNKTGTTTLKSALQELNIVMGSEREAKELLDPWMNRDFKPIIDYCKKAQGFQDSPFSLPYTYIILDYAFPNSKFILSVRDNAEQWYDSITRFHSKLWGTNGQIPTKEDLMSAINATKGRPWIVNRQLFNTPEKDPYNKKQLIEFYENYNRGVKDYFKNRDEDLLIVNVNKDNHYYELCNFLGKKPVRDKFPHKNKT